MVQVQPYQVARNESQGTFWALKVNGRRNSLSFEKILSDKDPLVLKFGTENYI